MDKVEARRLAEEVLESLRGEGYQTLVDKYLDNSEHRDVVGESGTQYQVEIQGFWDSTEPGDLRVLVSVDDGGWSAFSPLGTSFIIASDGSFVGE